MSTIVQSIPSNVQEALFGNSECQLEDLEPIFSHLHPKGITFSDIYLQSYQNEVVTFEDSQVKTIHLDKATGAGLRAVATSAQGFAYTTVLSPDSLAKTARQAATISQSHSQGSSIVRAPYLRFGQSHFPKAEYLVADKIKLLHQLDNYARSLDKDIYQVQLNLMSYLSYVLMMKEDGQISYDIRPLIRLDVHIYVNKNNKRESAYMGGGGQISWQEHTALGLGQAYVDEAYRQVLLNFEAQPAPTGAYDLVLGPGWPGILLHEAVGHGLEADFNRKKTSVYSDKIGQKIASSCCTVIDDGTLDKHRGSLGVDDEGTMTQKNILIEEGVLKKYMNDRQNAFLMNSELTGNGRRQSFMHAPMPRMTNTYLANGKYSHEEIVESLEDGVYAANFGGGSVDITSGQFVFSAQEAYRVKKGKILYPIKDMTMIGSGPDVMKNVLMVGNNLQFDSGIGICGKNGQSVPVGVGQPTVKVSGVTLGGTDAAG